MMSETECLHALFEDGSYAVPDLDGWDYILRDPNGEDVWVASDIVEQLRADGLVSIIGGEVRITNHGRTWLYLVCDVPVWR